MANRVVSHSENAGLFIKLAVIQITSYRGLNKVNTTSSLQQPAHKSLFCSSFVTEHKRVCKLTDMSLN